MIGLRGGGLAGHARQIAAAMGLDGAQSELVFIAARLLDIGKIGFGDALLALPLSQLQGAQLARFRQHPARAAALLMPLADLRGEAAILRAQLERFDGAAFPDGLAGVPIPLGARILALASDYESLQLGALLGRRPGADEARALICRGSAQRYDPDVAAAFLQVIEDR